MRNRTTHHPIITLYGRTQNYKLNHHNTAWSAFQIPWSIMLFDGLKAYSQINQATFSNSMLGWQRIYYEPFMSESRVWLIYCLSIARRMWWFGVGVSYAWTTHLYHLSFIPNSQTSPSTANVEDDRHRGFTRKPRNWLTASEHFVGALTSRQTNKPKLLPISGCTTFRVM